MRQIFIVAPLIVLLFFILYMFTPGPSRVTPPELFLPPDSILVVTQHQLEKRVKEFTASRLGKAVGSIDFQALADDLQVPGIAGDQAASIREELIRTFNDPLFNIIFGKEVTVGLFPFDLDISRDLPPQILENTLIICRPRHNAKLLDVLGSLVVEQDRIEEAQYGAHLIKRIPLEDQRTLAAVRVEDMFLFSLNERQLRTSLDRYDSGENNLEHSSGYKEYRERFADASLFAYVSVSEFGELISDAIPEAQGGRYQRTLDQMVVDGAYQALFFGAWRKQDTILEKVVIKFDEELLDKGTGTYLTASDESGATLSRVGEDSILYYWNSQFDLRPLLKQVAARQGGQRSGETGNGKARTDTFPGISGEQVERLANNDLTIVFKPIPTSQFVPIPHAMLAMRNQYPENLRSLVRTLIKRYRIPTRDVNINDVSGLSWGSLLGGGGLQPTLLFVDDYLVLTTNLQQAEEFTGGVSKEDSLLTSELFNRVGQDLVGDNQSIGFFNVSEITVMLKELISWGGTMIAIKDRDMARKSKILIDRLINPLLDGISMYSIVGTRKYMEDNLIIFESTTAIEDEER